MHDIRAIRDNPEQFDAALARRGLAPRAGELLALDKAWREATTLQQEAKARQNAASKAIGAAKAAKDEAKAQGLMAEVAQLKDTIEQAAEGETRFAGELKAALEIIPNLPAADVPEGADEHGNVEIKRIGAIPTFDFPVKDHVALGEGLAMMDFEAAARMSGARFVVLSGPLARLERALGQFMLDVQTGEHGYKEVNPPLMVRADALYGTGQLPKFADDLFKTQFDHWLIPTAEVSLTNLVRGQLLEEEALPMRLTALTPCFRAEAGSAGRDTRGMIRQHQFWKTELVSITTPEQSAQEHERMTRAAETILEMLALPYRRMLLCTGDMGFGATKTFDLEVWLPGQNAYREISSCSNCGDFQARRMDTRARAKGEKATRFVHTLNGSGLAVGRTLVAVMENYQNADGSITIPDALRGYLGGRERIAV